MKSDLILILLIVLTAGVFIITKIQFDDTSNEDKTVVDCLGELSEFTECRDVDDEAITCGDGTRYKVYTYTNNYNNLDEKTQTKGAKCSLNGVYKEDGEKMEIETCNMGSCPKPCELYYSEWSECAVECGFVGTQSRYAFVSQEPQGNDPETGLPYTCPDFLPLSRLCDGYSDIDCQEAGPVTGVRESIQVYIPYTMGNGGYDYTQVLQEVGDLHLIKLATFSSPASLSSDQWYTLDILNNNRINIITPSGKCIAFSETNSIVNLDECPDGAFAVSIVESGTYNLHNPVDESICLTFGRNSSWKWELRAGPCQDFITTAWSFHTINDNSRVIV